MTRKRIDLLAPPFKGHLHPILAMAKLLEPHYDVCIISSAAAKKDIQATGFESIVLDSIDDHALLQVVNPPQSVGNSPIALGRQFSEVLLFFQLLSKELDTIYIKRKPDLLIIDFTLPVAGLIADKYNLAWWTSLPSPCVLECKDGPPAYLGGLLPGTTVFGQARNWMGRKLVRLFKRVIFQLYATRIKALGLKHLYRKNGVEAIYSTKRILCLGHPSLEFSKRWPPQTSFVGPMLYSPPFSNIQPSFEPGKTHILVTLGTHLHSHQDRICDELKKICYKFSHCIIHFSEGNSDNDHLRQITPQFLRFSYLDYEKHISSYDLVIHHGGAGIMYYCLRNAIPSIVFPIDYDQFDNAARLEHNGLSIWLKNITDLEMTMDMALTSEALKRNVKNISHLLKDIDPLLLLSFVRDQISS